MAILPQRWPWEVRPASELPSEVQRYLADSETSALGGQLHEAVMIEPTLTAVGSIVAGLGVIKLVVDANLSDTTSSLITNIVLLLVLIALIRFAILYWVWGHDLIFITGKRIVYVHGIITRDVAMMPLAKLTDMSYVRSPLAMLLGYGTFNVESAGQVQALSKLSPIPNPDASYRYIQNLLLGKAITDTRIVDVATEKNLNVKWKGTRTTQQPTTMGKGTHIDQDEEDWYT